MSFDVAVVTEPATARPHGELSDFMAWVEGRNPGQPEFLQAVREFAEAIMPWYLTQAAYRDARILERVTEPDRAISFRVCWTGDDGRVRINRGYRVQFNGAIGPYKGGLRFHPTVNLSILKFLGFEQVFKNSLTTLPMGGGKGGSDFDPKDKSDGEVMRFCQSFMTELWRHIGPDTDVPAGDIGVGGREIGYLFGQYRRLANEWTGTLTGKDLPYGGSFIRPEATGYGAVYFMSAMLQTNRQETLEGKRCLVSGSGNVAQYTVEKVNHLGGTAITLSDSDGTIHDPAGIDADKLAWVMELKNVRRGRIREYAEHFTGVTYHPGIQPWGIPGDLAFPSATQNELDLDDAQALVANGLLGVAEGANMPTTLEATHYFLDQGVLFAPGKAANAGGVAVSGLEMSQNSTRTRWTREEVDRKLQGIMEAIHAQCCRDGLQPDGKINYVQGANIAGFRKVADALLAYGVV